MSRYNLVEVKTDPEMVQLATQLIERQSGAYESADIEDRYETRLRTMIDAKLKGEGIEEAETPAVATSNVVDLMAALKKSLGQGTATTPANASKRAAKPKPAAQAATASRKRA